MCVYVWARACASDMNNNRLIYKANTDMGGHVIVLVGNKADLESSRQVPRETAQNLADELNIRYESRDEARP